MSFFSQCATMHVHASVSTLVNAASLFNIPGTQDAPWNITLSNLERNKRNIRFQLGTEQ